MSANYEYHTLAIVTDCDVAPFKLRPAGLAFICPGTRSVALSFTTPGEAERQPDYTLNGLFKQELFRSFAAKTLKRFRSGCEFTCQLKQTVPLEVLYGND